MTWVIAMWASKSLYLRFPDVTVSFPLTVTAGSQLSCVSRHGWVRSRNLRYPQCLGNRISGCARRGKGGYTAGWRLRQAPHPRP